MVYRLLMLISIFLSSIYIYGENTLYDLRTLELKSPVGVESNPTFSWKINSAERGVSQTAYEITVVDENELVMWKSGLVRSSSQSNVVYSGKPLKSRTRYTWSVVVYDQHNRPSDAASSSFETGILSQEEWKNAKWISTQKSKSRSCYVVDLTRKGVKSRFVRFNITKGGLRCAADADYDYVQIAEIEIFNKRGENVAANAVFTTDNSLELNDHGWSVKYLNDGVVKGGATNGYTTNRNDVRTTILADLGSVQQLSRIVIYPRQDSPAFSDKGKAASFPSAFSVETPDGANDYQVRYNATDIEAPDYKLDNNVPYMGRDFVVKRNKKIASARVYASALGVFTMRLNGKRVTDNVLEPGESAFDKHILYSVYEVTSLLVPGKNVLLAQVAGGMAEMSHMDDRFVKYELKDNAADVSLRAMLYITYTDGTVDCVNTDDRWRYHDSPTVGSNWYGGETYDARLKMCGLYDSSLDMRDWERCVEVSPTFCAPSVSSKVLPVGDMRVREYAPLRVVETWPAVRVTKNNKGNYLVDFGQNFAGTYVFNLKAPRGTTITLYDSELQSDNSCVFEFMYQGRGMTNKTLDSYVFAGDEGGETWGPEFMYHGFRYLEISGLTFEPKPEDFTAMRIRSDMDVVGYFHTSDTLLNDIHRICFNGIQSQLYNTVTDCPHREKLGWLDVPNMLYQSLCYNFDVRKLLSKVVMDAFDSQGENGYVPSTVPHFMRAYDDDLNWGGAAITIPWRMYKQYGDKTLITCYYDNMKRLITYYGALTKDNIIRNDYSVLSDWGQETSGVKNHTSSSFTLTCSYYYMLRAMSEVATALGHDDDALLWTSKASDVKSAFNRKFFHDGVYEFGNQANYGMTLFYGLVDSAYVKSVAKTLAETVMSSDYSIKAGEIGLRPILMALSDNGYNDVVYRMAKKTTFPSYGYWLKCGATTSLEYWDLSLSQNHCMMDHIEEWFYGKLGGISDLGDAYRQLRLSPWIPSDMASADVRLQSPRGMVRVSWNRTAESTEYLLSVPVGSTAEVCLPVLKGERLMENGHDLREIASVSNVEYTDSLVTFILGSGDYRFTMNGSTLSSQDK